MPTIYSGDEQGFIGDGNDQDSRQDMFASEVPVANIGSLLGTTTTGTVAHFGQANLLFKQNAALAPGCCAHARRSRACSRSRASI